MAFATDSFFNEVLRVRGVSRPLALRSPFNGVARYSRVRRSIIAAKPINAVSISGSQIEATNPFRHELPITRLDAVTVRHAVGRVGRADFADEARRAAPATAAGWTDTAFRRAIASSARRVYRVARQTSGLAAHSRQASLAGPSHGRSSKSLRHRVSPSWSAAARAPIRTLPDPAPHARARTRRPSRTAHARRSRSPCPSTQGQRVRAFSSRRDHGRECSAGRHEPWLDDRGVGSSRCRRRGVDRERRPLTPTPTGAKS